MVTALLSKSGCGADVDLFNPRTGYTPLHLAVVQDDPAMVSLLIDVSMLPVSVDAWLAGSLPACLPACKCDTPGDIALAEWCQPGHPITRGWHDSSSLGCLESCHIFGGWEHASAEGRGRRRCS